MRNGVSGDCRILQVTVYTGRAVLEIRGVTMGWACRSYGGDIHTKS
jgi:hypothetical protein